MTFWHDDGVRGQDDDVMGLAVLLALVLVFLGIIAGCGYANKVAAWPARGALICVENGTDKPIVVVAEEADRGRQIVIMQRVAAGSRFTARWPFVAMRGRLLAGPPSGFKPEAAFMTRQFAPWDGERWHWRVTLGSFGDSIAVGGCP